MNLFHKRHCYTVLDFPSVCSMNLKYAKKLFAKMYKKLNVTNYFKDLLNRAVYVKH